MYTKELSMENLRELEKIVIGAMLVKPEDVIQEISDILKVEHFLHYPKIVSKILELYNERKVEEITPVSIYNIASQYGLTYADIAEMMTAFITLEDARKASELLRNAYLWRDLQRSARQVLDRSTIPDTEELEKILNNFQTDIQRISDKQQSDDDIKNMSDVLNEVMKDVFEDRPQNVLKTGIAKLDQFTGGFKDDELIVIAGRTSMGKTALSLSMLDNMLKKGKKIVYFTLEMSIKSMVQRMISAVGHIDTNIWKHTDENNRLIALQKPDISKRIVEASGILETRPGDVEWIEKPHTVEEIRGRVRKLKRTKGIDGVIIDYISLITPTYPHQTPNEHLTHSIRVLKMIAKEMRIPVIVLAQINRAVEGRNDKRPLLSDLKDSGSLEQEADIVLLLYRDGYYNPPVQKPGEITLEELEIIVAKNRNGAVGTIKAGYIKEFAKVVNLPQKQQGDNKVIDLLKKQNNREQARF